MFRRSHPYARSQRQCPVIPSGLHERGGRVHQGEVAETSQVREGQLLEDDHHVRQVPVEGHGRDKGDLPSGTVDRELMPGCRDPVWRRCSHRLRFRPHRGHVRSGRSFPQERGMRRMKGAVLRRSLRTRSAETASDGSGHRCPARGGLPDPKSRNAPPVGRIGVGFHLSLMVSRFNGALVSIPYFL